MNQLPPECHSVYIGLGGNVANPAQTLRSGRIALAGQAGIQEKACSSLYRSTPMGPADQPDYVNAVMWIETTLTPIQLLDVLQAIENSHGRIRQGERWGPRTLDLDILLYDDLTMNESRLTLPHPGVTEREFVLYPLAEIAPAGLCIPGKGLLSDWLQRCPRRGLTVLPDV
jgi:2-amino-4-hydroxy-6-hydroxymethyldihydropteridine diphosphokinase